MADVRTIKAAIKADSIAYPENKGTISAYTLVNATGFNGMRVFKRVRIGVEFGVSVDTAKEMMRNIREANADSGMSNILGKFVMEM